MCIIEAALSILLISEAGNPVRRSSSDGSSRLKGAASSAHSSPVRSPPTTGNFSSSLKSAHAEFISSDGLDIFTSVGSSGSGAFEVVVGLVVAGLVVAGLVVAGLVVAGLVVAGLVVAGLVVVGLVVSGLVVSGALVSGTLVSGALISGSAVSGEMVSGSPDSGLPVSRVVVSGSEVSGAGSVSSVFEVSDDDVVSAADDTSSVAAPLPVLLLSVLHPASESTINAAIMIDVNFFINSSVCKFVIVSFLLPSIPGRGRHTKGAVSGCRFRSAR